MSTLSFDPSEREFGSTSVEPLSFDATPLLVAGETLTGGTVTLYDMRAQADYPAGLEGDPAIAGTLVTQTVGNLVAGRRYRLVVTFQTSAGRSLPRELILNCVF